MQINLQLATKGPTMWFLGEPKNLKASLNFANPGPVGVDFDALSLEEQKHVIISIQTSLVTGDVGLTELFEIYTKKRDKEAPVEVKEYLEEQKETKAAEQKAKAISKAEKRIIEIQKRCEYLVKQPIRSIKSALANEKDTRLLRTFLKIEQEGKKRVSVVDILETKIKKIQQAINKKIEDASKHEPLNVRAPGETKIGDVVDLEEKTVILSEEDLQRLVERT